MQDAGPSLIVADGTLPKLAFQLSNDAWHTPPELWLYGLAALLLIALGWWLTRRRGPVLRSLLRAGVAAFLLSPAILACEIISVMPFPVLLSLALGDRASVSCGAPLVALPPNAMTFGGIWLVLFLAFWCWDWFRRPNVR